MQEQFCTFEFQNNQEGTKYILFLCSSMFEVCARVPMCVHVRLCTFVCVHVCAFYILQLFVVGFNQLSYFWLNVECMQNTVVSFI